MFKKRIEKCDDVTSDLTLSLMNILTTETKGNILDTSTESFAKEYFENLDSSS